MEGEEEAGLEVVDVVDKYEEDVDLGILMLVVLINGNSQASIEIWLKFIYSIVLNKTTS